MPGPCYKLFKKSILVKNCLKNPSICKKFLKKKTRPCKKIYKNVDNYFKINVFVKIYKNPRPC